MGTAGQVQGRADSFGNNLHALRGSILPENLA